MPLVLLSQLWHSTRSGKILFSIAVGYATGKLVSKVKIMTGPQSSSAPSFSEPGSRLKSGGYLTNTRKSILTKKILNFQVCHTRMRNLIAFLIQSWKKAINPKGLVPAVEYKGKALYESLILCEFFEDAFPDYKPNLLPSDPVQRAVARLWLDHLTKTFIPAFHRLLQEQEAEKQHSALQELYESLRKLAGSIQGPYFFGESFSLVDVAIAPWIVRDFVLEENRGYKRGDVSSNWKKYAEIVEVRDSVVRTQSVSSFSHCQKFVALLIIYR